MARLGGDEFTLLLPGQRQAEDAARVAQKVCDLVKAPLVVDGHELVVTTSIGVSLYPDDGGSPEALLKNADAAMYLAKEQGRDTFRLYTRAMNALALERLRLESSLRKALVLDQFVLHFQPVVDVASGALHGTEALLRWRHPELGLLLPGDFIGLAELTGLITPVGPWIVRTACQTTRAWHDRRPGLAVSVNLSARQLLRADLTEEVAGALQRSGLPAQCLELEITESLAMHHADGIVGTLHELRRLGVRLSIDDFGAGYSSLSYLKRFPVDTLKIDQSFVRDIRDDSSDAAIVTTVIAMARSLGLRVVAEGVERHEQLSWLRRHGCHLVQGHLFSRALPAEQIEPLLDRGVLTPVETAL